MGVWTLQLDISYAETRGEKPYNRMEPQKKPDAKQLWSYQSSTSEFILKRLAAQQLSKKMKKARKAQEHISLGQLQANTPAYQQLDPTNSLIYSAAWSF